MAHHYIAEALVKGKAITEYDVVQFILDQFERHDMTTQYAPNCSVDANAGDPHYEPSADGSRTIQKSQLVLIDLWAKLKKPGSVYGDITWMAFAGSQDEIPKKYHEVFGVLTKARGAAVTYLNDHFGGDRPLYGADVDDACRKVVVDAGYDEFFTHRTGHSITTSEHGTGPNIDNLETEDRRVLKPGHLFSVEPGIYTDKYGLRTEINVLITDDGPEVTTLPLQFEIIPLL
jgi:Xaa-Pro aminopeptidase